MGVQLKKRQKVLPLSKFCTARKCSKAPVKRVREMQTQVILDLCNGHANGLLQFARHAYVVVTPPEGNHAA